MPFRKRLRQILTHPFTQLLVGVCMVGTGLSELAEAIDGALVSSAHGVVLYGFLQAGKAVMELLEGLEKVEDRGRPETGAQAE